MLGSKNLKVLLCTPKEKSHHPYISNLLQYLKNCPEINYRLKNQIIFFKDYDIIHFTHMPSSFPIPIKLILKKNLNNIIVTFHTSRNKEFKIPSLINKIFFYKIASTINIEMAKKRLNELGKIIVLSQSEKRLTQKYLNVKEDKIEVIYPCVENYFKIYKYNYCKEMLEKFLSMNLEEEFILHVSNFMPVKNIRNLLRAFEILKRVFKVNEKLLMVGYPVEFHSYFTHLKSFWSERLGKENIIFLGYVDRKLLPYIYNLAKVYVHPSFYESFGFAILEAMSCGCPVVTSNKYACSEIVDDAGIKVDPENVKEIANSIYAILTDKNLRLKLKRKSLKRAKEFSLEKFGEKHLGVYYEVVENNS